MVQVLGFLGCKTKKIILNVHFLVFGGSRVHDFEIIPGFRIVHSLQGKYLSRENVCWIQPLHGSESNTDHNALTRTWNYFVLFILPLFLLFCYFTLSHTFGVLFHTFGVLSRTFGVLSHTFGVLVVDYSSFCYFDNFKLYLENSIHDSAKFVSSTVNTEVLRFHLSRCLTFLKSLNYFKDWKRKGKF